MYDYDAVIIGGGLGGLSTAALLSHKGYRVLVCEYADQVGGCCSSFQTKEGYRFDVGASVVELTFILDKLFELIGKKTSDYIDLISIDPIYSFTTQDGRRFSYPVDSKATREVIAQLSEKDAEAWDRFAKMGSEAVNKAFGEVMDKPMMNFTDAIKIGIKMPEFIKYMPFMLNNFENTLTKFFKNDAVRGSMSLQSYYIGLPPALCPGYAAFLAYSEHEGVFYPKGGMGKIPDGIADATMEFGGEIKCNARVTKVIVENGRAVGIEMEDGTQITSRMVVSNINAKNLYLDLLGREHLPRWAEKAIDSYRLSCTAPMIMLGLNKAPDLEGHHTICYGTLEDMNSAWFDYMEKGLIPPAGFTLISWPTHADPSLAPKGHHCLNIVIGAPYKLAEGTWDEKREEYIEMFIDAIESKFNIELRDSITYAHVNTPTDFEKMLLMPEAAVYGFLSDLTATAMFRPSMKSRIVKNLYLCGASTQYGGGVPTVIGSGIALNEVIERDFG